MTVSHIQSFSYAPSGVIASHVGSAPPPGWLLCNGSELAVSSYRQLYNALTNGGAVFPYGANTNGSGGAGSTHFRLPNLTDRFAIHKSSAVGGSGGANTHDHPFTTNATIANVPSGEHSHGVAVFTIESYSTDVTHGFTLQNTSSGPIGGNVAVRGASAINNASTPTHNHNASTGGSLSATANHNHSSSINANTSLSPNHEQSHIPNANIASFINQVTYQASSSTMATANNPTTNTKIRAIIKI